MENEKEQIPEGSAETAEEKTAKAPKGILLTPGKLVALIIGVVLLVAVLVGAIVYGMGGFSKVNDPTAGESAPSAMPETTDPVESVPVETVPATTPADTGEDNVTYKGTYTVSDEEMADWENAIVATTGYEQLTNKELQVYYWMQVQNFFSNYYYYLSYFGLDYNQPMDTQICNVLENGYTWQQYFLEQALMNWHSYQALAHMAEANGLTLDAERQEYLDGLADSLLATAQAQGYETADELVQFNVGASGDLETYIAYEKLFLIGDVYYSQKEAAIELTDAEIEAYFDANAETFAESGITKDGVYVDVRHILVVPEGKNPGDEYTDDEWASCEADAQALLDQWLAGDATEDSFAALANEHSVDSDGTDGGLYQNVYEGQMVANFNDWCFDENRQYGDYGIVQTEYGYHIMFFVDRYPMWTSYAESALMQEKVAAIVEEAREAYPMEVNYSAIALGHVDVSKWFGQ